MGPGAGPPFPLDPRDLDTDARRGLWTNVFRFTNRDDVTAAGTTGTCATNGKRRALHATCSRPATDAGMLEISISPLRGLGLHRHQGAHLGHQPLPVLR